MRRALIFLLICGCARPVPTTTATPTAATNEKPSRTAIFNDPTLATVYKDAPSAIMASIAKPPQQVAAAMRLAYASIGVPITVDDAKGTRIGNADFFRSRNFAGKAMTQLVSCGSSMTGPNASSYRIFMSLITTLKADDRGRTDVSVLFVSTAQDIAGGATNDRVTCGTTGVLEKLLIEKAESYLEK